MANQDHKKDGGYSREGLFGEIIHYDADGHKTGSSQEDLFGGYTHTDNAGHVTGHSGRTVFGVILLIAIITILAGKH